MGFLPGGEPARAEPGRRTALDAQSRGVDRARPSRSRPPLVRRRGRERPLDERLHVLVGDAVLEAVAYDLCEVHAEFAREAAHRGTGVGAREGRIVDRCQIAAIGGRHTEEGAGRERTTA